MGFPWDVLAFGTDVAFALIFYQAYKSSAKLEEAAKVCNWSKLINLINIHNINILSFVLFLLKNAPFFETSAELMQALESSPDKTLNYAGIGGVVKELETPLRSSYGSTQGVIQNLSVVEHKSRRSQGYW